MSSRDRSLAPIPRKRLSVDLLAAGIRQATSDGRMLDRARRMGETISREDGVARAVEHFHRSLERAM